MDSSSLLQIETKLSLQTGNVVSDRHLSFSDLLVSLSLSSRNQVLNVSILFETLLAILISYTPYLNQGLMMYPLKSVCSSSSSFFQS